MADVKKPRGRINRTLFPLAWKLSLAVSAILISSLGIIIFSVWLFFRSDEAKTAAAVNDSINFRVAAAADSVLKQIRAETSMFLGSAYAEDGDAFREKLIDHYFGRNPDIAAVVAVSAGRGARALINEAFIRSNEINGSLFTEYLNMGGSRLLRDDSEALLMNAGPDFYGLPILAARFPYISGEELNLVPSAAIVFFSSGELADYFSYGTSRSFLLGGSGEILIQGSEEGMEIIPSNILSRLYSGGEKHLRTRDRRGSFVSARLIDFNTALFTIISGSVVFEGIDATTRRNLYLALFVWFVSLFFISFFSFRLTRQLGILREAAEAIENGLYRRVIPGSARDETGFLTDRMNNMRNRLGHFERFTNKQIARLTRKGLIKPGGSTKNAVFLFSDIRSFTAISEKMDPAELVSFLNGYMERMVSCIMVTGGVVDKFIGDGILAHWGAIVEDEVPDQSVFVRAALRSALLMRAVLQSFNAERPDKPCIKMGVGISSGKVAAGVIGTDERLVYTVIGEAVSMAEKAEAANKFYGTETMVLDRTVEEAGEDFITEAPQGQEASAPFKTFSALVNVRSEKQTKRLMTEMEILPYIDLSVASRYAGPEGPETLDQLRALLDISPEETDERETKFKVQKS